MAPVISGGELIDGLAGGMCQIASTLHAAAFFAGLDIVSSTPHSRPSAYIPMGLDSTVVYPSTDLKLRNPYDFPVVMHYPVNQGAVKVELLGKERPYRGRLRARDQDGDAVRHRDARRSGGAVGAALHVQEGYPGYTLDSAALHLRQGSSAALGGAGAARRRARRSRAMKPVKKEQWSLHYPATTQFVAVGHRAVVAEAEAGAAVAPHPADQQRTTSRSSSS